MLRNLRFFIQRCSDRFSKNFAMEIAKSKPLVVVGGCTGTGKSDLGIAIAKRFNGEVISADSMQIYKGLDIVTNKVTEEEMDGIPHHLMSFYEPTESEFNVHSYRNKVLPIIESLWADGKLPVLVGGTSYYIEGVLYNGNLVTEALAENNPEIRARLSAMPTEELYRKLQEIDPASAAQIHRNNRFRVLRAVEIFELTGKKKSDILEEQKKCQNETKTGNEPSTSDIDAGLRFPNTLLINVDADPEVLNARFRSRIEKMVKRGLQSELEEFYDKYHKDLSTHGVFQSIGLKEFSEFLKLDPSKRSDSEGKKLFQIGCDRLTQATVRYAKKQRMWLKQRFLRRKQIRQLPQLVAANSTDTSSFFSKLVPQSLEVIERFLDGKPLRLCEFGDANPKLISDPMEAISTEDMRDAGYAKRANTVYRCDACGIDIHSENCWKTHIAGKKHRSNVKKRRIESQN